MVQVASMPYAYPGEGPGLWQGGAGPVIFNVRPPVSSHPGGLFNGSPAFI
jgi:hypothetical protein